MEFEIGLMRKKTESNDFEKTNERLLGNLIIGIRYEINFEGKKNIQR